MGSITAEDDAWLVTGDDSGRFRFEIIKSGTESMNLQASGGEGKVDLSWMQDDFDLLAGYNLYRSTSQSGTYSRINQFLMPAQQKSFKDTNVVPGQPYYYKFKVVKSDMSESDFSNVASGTPLDTIPPVLTHTPITSAAPGLPLTLTADVTDNVGVQSVTLFFRTAAAIAPQANWEAPDISKASIGARTILSAGEDDELARAPSGLESPRSLPRSFVRSAIAAQSTEAYISREMTRSGGTGNRYAATIEGSRLVSPGIEYYMEATDGISTVRTVSPGFPHMVTVVDKPVITAVSPNRGPASGGTAVTIAGANFKNNAGVTFGNMPAADVTVVSSTQISCTAPIHFPETVDVVVRNPDGQSGILLRAFTFESDIANLSLPNTGGAQHDVVQVPLNAVNVQGMVAVDLTNSFDAAVLRPLGARAGSLTASWSVAANTNNPGQIRLAMAITGGAVSGAGTLAWLEFEVVGAPGSSSPLQIASASLNDGAIRVETADGSFAVALAYRISGIVTFWKNSAPVPGVVQTLSGNRVFVGETDASGSCTVSGAPAGAYTLAPSKSDETNGITGFDASLVLQHAAGLTNLTGLAATAADVNKSGVISSMDAYYILQKAVNLILLPFPGAGKVWEFSPVNRTYSNLNSDLSGQDFTAILLGDVSGNWSAEGGVGPQSLAPEADGSADNLVRTLTQGEVEADRIVRAPAAASSAVTLALRRFVGASNDTRVWLLAKTAGQGIYSVDLDLSYGPSNTLNNIRTGAFAQTFALAVNTNEAGLARVALAGALPLQGVGALLEFAMPMEPGGEVCIARASINEGSVPVRIESDTSDSESDSDGDGQTDLSELRAGTDPNRHDSVFKATRVIANPDGSKTVTWAAVPGKSYRVVCREGVEEGVWKELGEVIKAEGPTASYVDRTATTSPERIYRVKLID